MKILKSDKGSTSILVVIFMIVLMIFGLSILTTAISNTRLAEKKREWLKDYYALEADVALELAKIDEILDHEKLRVKDDEEEGRLEGIVKRSTAYQNYINDELTKQGYNIYGLDNNESFNINLYFDLKEVKGKIPKHITVELEILIPEDQKSDEEFLLMRNYDIISHTEWQNAFEYKDSIKFEDPFDNPEN